MLEVEHLTKRFGTLTAVDDLSFTARPGRVTGFLGPNGAGKTTTMRVALGLMAPTSGRATFGGVPYQRLERPLRQVGSALEASSFHPGRTARDHLLMLAAAARVGAARVGEVLGLVGLSAAADRRVGGFSLGMRARLSLAAALLGDPTVLLLDEPSNGLDPEGIVWLRDLTRALAADGKAVVVSSHLLAEVQNAVDDVVIIAHGRLVHASPLDELAQEQDNRTVVVAADPDALGRLAAARGWTLRPDPDGPPGGPAAAGAVVVGPTAAEIGHAAHLAGVELHQLTTQRGGLEAVFLALTEGQGDIR
ncbi:MAG: ATP-binding cassette domain-containing protein [Propionibacteriaceae bacterium]|jgi:ABC-2 type transport system ATP-binding protein|nr:ATP-binding cassette domain-containing protein [Propionibacteriaceae bacterium]